MDAKETLLKIGEFSQLSQVTVKTLHHYSDLGLFMPAHIDPHNNYRYYNIDQLPTIHRIMALKEIGLSLEQIKKMLNEGLSTEEIRGMLRLKQSEINTQIRETERQMALIEFRLRMIDAEDKFPNLDVVIKRLEPLNVLSFFVKKHHTRQKIGEIVQSAIDEGALEFTGVALDVYHGETILPLESPEIQDGQHEIMLGVSASQESITLPEIGELRARVEPEIETAATLMLYKDKSPEVFERVTLLHRWAIAHGYQLSGRVRYWHHRGPMETQNPEEYIIEVQLPVKTASEK
jgi:DNA-binding transcriptional MerR regulator